MENKTSRMISKLISKHHKSCISIHSYMDKLKHFDIKKNTKHTYTNVHKCDIININEITKEVLRIKNSLMIATKIVVIKKV